MIYAFDLLYAELWFCSFDVDVDVDVDVNLKRFFSKCSFDNQSILCDKDSVLAQFVEVSTTVGIQDGSE